MPKNITTSDLEVALTKLVEDMGTSIVEYVQQKSRTPDTKIAKDKLRENMGLKKR